MLGTLAVGALELTVGYEGSSGWLIATGGTEVAATGKPAYHANFTITDK
jgi:hypothetical protein